MHQKQRVATQAQLQDLKIYALICFKRIQFYIELQGGIKVVETLASQPATKADHFQEKSDRIEKEIELLRKRYATEKIEVFEATTIKFRAIAIGH